MAASPGERIRAALAAVAEDSGRLVTSAHPSALGWATVELDRAARELADDLGLAADAFVPVADSVALGARCRVAHQAIPGGVALAILEPATEGRLAATLARLGEGPAAAWFVTDGTLAAEEPAAAAGPFGPERLMPGGAIRGLRWLLIGPEAGTIRT